MSVKHISLVVLTVQNSALILTMRLSRILPGDKYRPTTAVVLSELLKTILSFIILLCSRPRSSSRSAQSGNGDTLSNRDLNQQGGTFPTFLSQCLRDIFSTKNGFVAVLLPAILYTVQNNLQYVAATNLDAATFQTTYQGKVLATAFFAVIILRQILTYVKWIAILILTAGVTLISYPAEPLIKPGQQPTAPSVHQGNRMLGLSAVGAACLISGFTGVYLEHLLKKVRDSQTQTGASMLWTRNVQLCMASVVVALIAAITIDGPAIWQDGFFFGYNFVVWATILLQAGGGLIVALVITYADNILKTFATTISTIISTTVSVMMGDCVLTVWFTSGVFLVLVATNLYGAGSFMGSATKRNEKLSNFATQTNDEEAVRWKEPEIDVDSEKHRLVTVQEIGRG